MTRLADILGNKYVRVGSLSCERADEATKLHHRGSVSVLLSSDHDDDGGGWCVMGASTSGKHHHKISLAFTWLGSYRIHPVYSEVVKDIIIILVGDLTS